MIEALLEHEAMLRAEAKAKVERMRAVVVEKKEELEGLSISELKKMCDSRGFKGTMSKQERVSKLLAEWQDNDGVDKALAQLAFDERKDTLTSKDSEALLKICDKASIDAFVKEVMVERILKKELDAGRYARPDAAAKEEAAPTAEKAGDMVEALLAKESSRKQEQ